MKAPTLLLLAVFTGAVLADKRRYDGYKLIEVTLSTELESQRLRDVELQSNLDVVWLGRGKAHIMVSPDMLADVTHFLRAARMDFKTLQEDMQMAMDDVDRLITRRREDWDTFDYDYNNYNDFDTVVQELYALAADCPAGFTCEVVDIGDSYNGENLWELRVNNGVPGSRAYFLDATIHAREWLATSTLMKITNKLIRDYSTDADAQRLMDTYNFYIVPNVNPDGYIHTWVEDRMWRKSRSPNEGSPCMGTDLNRNFDYLWGEEGASDNPCSDTYAGASPASEVEIQGMQAEASRVATELDAWVSYHTYGQMFLHSWGHFDSGVQCAYADDHDELLAVATASTDAIEATHGTTWSPGNWCEVLYASTGITVDYMKAVAGVKYTYTPELRGGRFDPPPSEIEPAFEEMWNGLVAMVAEIESQKVNAL